MSQIHPGQTTLTQPTRKEENKVLPTFSLPIINQHEPTLLHSVTKNHESNKDSYLKTTNLVAERNKNHISQTKKPIETSVISVSSVLKNKQKPSSSSFAFPSS